MRSFAYVLAVAPLLLGRSHVAEAACGGADSSQTLPRFTPKQSDWSPTCGKVADHTPPGTVAWDKTTIYNPVTSLDLATPRDESAFFNQMCPKNAGGKHVLRGLRQRFDEFKPFADNANPTKAEVDRWNGVVLTHIRKLAGIDHEAKPDVCLSARALWANQWRHTTIWSPADATNPNRYVCPPAGSDAHCGASFVPNTMEKQMPYLPQGHGKCSATAGAEGAFGHSPSSPWSLKTAEVFCGTLKAEGYWGGHTGPFWGREKFGFGFWHDGSARFKWGGVRKASIYADPRKDMFTKLDGLDASCQTKVCADLFWPGVAFDTAQQCRDYVLDSPLCSNRFFTYNQGNRGCGCYPPGKAECGKVQAQASRNTFLLTPVDSGSRNLGPVPAGGPYHARTASCEVKSVKAPKWTGRQCGNKIKWIGKSCDRQMCLEMILADPDCDHKYMMLNANDGNSCACYPPDQAPIVDASKDCIRSSGREFYDIVDGCSGVAGENAQLDACGVCNGANACFTSDSPSAGAAGTAGKCEASPAKVCGAPPTDLVLLAGKTPAAPCSAPTGSAACNAECFGKAPPACDATCADTRTRGRRRGERTVAVPTTSTGCDTVRAQCCGYNTKYGMVPSRTWGSTPKAEQAWHAANSCDSKMGGTALTECPYTCN